MTGSKKNRIKEVKTLISSGIRSSRIAELKAEEWGVSERQVYKYISQAKELSGEKDREQQLNELSEAFERFQESKNKFKVWECIDFDAPAVYEIPDEERKEWNYFIRYGWAQPERIKKVIQKDNTGLEKLDQYCEGVRSAEINVCKEVRWSVDRHYRNLERQIEDDFPYYFEPNAALHYIRFFETKLKHHTGIMSGEPIIFEPWQWFSYGSIFGWLKKERFRDFPLRRFKTANIIMPKKNGKALAIDTPIPTPFGFKNMGDIQVGDKVFGRNGKPCNVVAVTDIMYNRPCYELEFSDGNKVVADENHEWSTSSHVFRENKLRTESFNESIRTTKEIYKSVLVERCKKESYNYVHRNHRINKNPCVEYSEKELPIDPYVFGLWLGDGSSNNASITIGHQDLITAQRIKDAGYDIRKRKSTNKNSELFGIGRNKPSGICNKGHLKRKYWNENGAGSGRGKCRACDKLALRARKNGNDVPEVIYKTTNEIIAEIGVKNNKHIPTCYLLSSKKQRIELLQGLMDSDGYCSKAGQCEFTSTNKRLADNTLELLLSLGIKATMGESEARLNGRFISQKYRIHFYAYDNMPVFKLKRKLSRQKKRPKSKTRNSYRQIINVKKVDSVPVKCIQVDSIDNMYLCSKGFIETHNSLISGNTGIYMNEFDGWPGAQCFIIATSQSHAMELGYRDATIMIDNNEWLGERYEIKRGGATIGIYCNGNNSYYKPITSKEDSEDGKNVHFCGPDETKDLEDPGVYNLMEEGMVSAPNGLMMNTSTEGFSDTSLLADQRDYLEDVLDPNSGIEDETLFGVIFTVDESDRYDEDGKEIEGWWSNLDLYKKANPNYGVSVFEDAIKAKFQKARKSLAKRSSLITKHLNVRTSSNSALIPSEKWNACGTLDQIPLMLKQPDGTLDIDSALQEYRGKVAHGGLDLGGNSDFTSFELVFEDGKTLSLFWIPEDTIADRPNSAIISEWVRKGYIFTTPGDWTDHDFIEECIKEIASIVDLQEVAYDRYKMNQMVTHLENEGINMVPFGQGFVSMAPAIDHLEDQILKQKIEHFDNPVLSWMNGNVSIRMDPAGNRKFDKDKSKDKIDGMVALAMALYRSSISEDEGASDWDDFKMIDMEA